MKVDPLLLIVFVVFAVPAVAALGYVGWLLVSVLFGGGGSSCPQNLC